MAVTSTSYTTQPLPRLPAAAPRLVDDVVGGILELMIHAVEDWRDRRRSR
ncbi:MAG TPA: hypothetical protein VIX73_22560 [Kofleriaceae bacterium]|jgi:hypothetical protein